VYYQIFGSDKVFFGRAAVNFYTQRYCPAVVMKYFRFAINNNFYSEQLV